MAKNVKQKNPTIKLIEDESKKIPRLGDLIECRVISVGKSEILLDIDGITTGIVRGHELIDESGEYSDIKLNDIVQATVLDLENERGMMELSFRSAGHQKAWDYLEDLKKSGEIVEVKVLEANKGGLIVKLNQILGFLPVSQLKAEHYPRVEGGNKGKILERLRSYVGQMFSIKVIDLLETEEKLIVSEKEAYAKEKEQALSDFKVGATVEGRISGVVDFGAFVSFGNGLEGLVHISEIAWQRLDHPKDVLKVGDNVKAQIIGIDNGKVSLSLKNLIDDPWKKAAEKYKVGDVIQGRVLKLDKFGAFVELDTEIHGLAHVSELADKNVRDPEEVVNVGGSYSFKILSIEPADHRLGLSRKSLKKDEDNFDDPDKKNIKKKGEEKEEDEQEQDKNNLQEQKEENEK